jgi:hypothetical protein
MSSVEERARFAAAHLRLLLAVDSRRLRNVEAVLAEDGKTVLLLAPDGKGHWATAGFELDMPTTEDAFDGTSIIEALERSDSGDKECLPES